MIFAGIDAGSRTPRSYSSTATAWTCAAGVVDQGIEQDALAESLLDRLLQENGLDRSQLAMVVATGYGRKLIRVADASITRLHARLGVSVIGMPEARTIIDIGGQDSKLLRTFTRWHSGRLCDERPLRRWHWPFL